MRTVTTNPVLNPDLALVAPRRRAKKRRGNDTITAHRLPACPESGKVRYRDHAQASDALKSAKESRARDEREGRSSKRREIRSYKCPECRGWHNTSVAQWAVLVDLRPELGAVDEMTLLVAS